MKTRPAYRRHLLQTREIDAEQAAIAATLQQICPHWLLMWSRSRQTFTAFACFTSEPVIIDADNVHIFLARLKQVERESIPRRKKFPH